jgi:hypothetical protein
MCAKPPATFGEGFKRRRGKGANRNGISLVTGIHHPHQLGPICAIVLHAFITDDPEPTIKQWQHGVRKAVEWWGMVPLGYNLDVAHV